VLLQVLQVLIHLGLVLFGESSGGFSLRLMLLSLRLVLLGLGLVLLSHLFSSLELLLHFLELRYLGLELSFKQFFEAGVLVLLLSSFFLFLALGSLLIFKLSCGLIKCLLSLLQLLFQHFQRLNSLCLLLDLLGQSLDFFSLGLDLLFVGFELLVFGHELVRGRVKVFLDALEGSAGFVKLLTGSF